MEYTLYAPQKITIRTDDLGDIPMLMTLPKLARFIPAVTLSNPMVIANRSDVTPVNSPIFIRINLEFDANEVAGIDELEKNVTIWAQRCRIGGVRGQRLAVVSEPENNGDTIRFTVMLGTVVYYNERRATVGVSVTDDELRQDLSNLFNFVPVEPTVQRIDDGGLNVQIFPVPLPAPTFSITLTPAQPTVSLEQVVLSLIRLGTEAAPLLLSRDQFDEQELRDRVDNLQLELSSVRSQLG